MPPNGDIPLLVGIHAGTAIAATTIGSVVLWARMGVKKHPRLHRVLGYAWFTLMVVTATSAVFIRDAHIPSISGITPIHVLVPFTFYYLVRGYRALLRGEINAHKRSMQALYVGACVIAGFFTLLPQRLLGHWLWSSLGLI